MPFILDDTEVNEPVYRDFVRSLTLRKKKRPALASRVRRLEAIIQRIQEHLPEPYLPNEKSINVLSKSLREEKAKPYVRR